MIKTVNFLIIIILLPIAIFAEGRVSGKVFYNYTLGLDDEQQNAFNVNRAYLTYVNRMNESLTYKVTYDMGSNEAGSAHTAFLKVAMVEWKTKFGDMMIGMQGMNMFKTMENTWGHRFIAKMPMDTYGFSASADLGIGMKKTFGPIFISSLITNGGGYKKLESDKYKKISMHAVYGETKLNKKDGFNAGMSLSYEPYEDDTDETSKRSHVLGIFSGYAGRGFRGGIEVDSKEQNEFSAKILAIYGTYKVNDKLSILSRYVDQGEKGELGEFSIITGIHYSLTQGLIVAPTFRASKVGVDGKYEKTLVINFQYMF